MFTGHLQSRKRQSQTRRSFMLVHFPTLHLAFDMMQLYKVIPMPEVFYSQAMLLGLAEIDGGEVDTPSSRQVIVIDLHRKLYGVSIESPNHLLLLNANDGLLYGVPVETLPEMRSIAAELLISEADDAKSIPVAGMTRQVLKVTEPSGEQILFIVDGDSLAQEVRQLADQTMPRQ